MTGFATKEGHPQERKFLRFPSTSVGIGPGVPPKCKMSRFLLRQFQMELLPPMAETFQKSLGIRPGLEAGQDIIGKTEPIGFAPTVPTDPPLKPEVQDVMEVDMRKEGGEDRALRRSDLCSLDESLFHDASLSHPANQAKNSLISDPLPQKLQPPLVMHRVEKASYGSFDAVVHTLLLDGAAQCI